MEARAKFDIVPLSPKNSNSYFHDYDFFDFPQLPVASNELHVADKRGCRYSSIRNFKAVFSSYARGGFRDEIVERNRYEIFEKRADPLKLRVVQPGDRKRFRYGD